MLKAEKRENKFTVGRCGARIDALRRRDSLQQVHPCLCGRAALPGKLDEDFPVGISGRQPGWQFVRGHRAREEEALKFVAVGATQDSDLLRGLHALGNHLQAESVTEPDDGARDCEIGRVVEHVVHERAVHLQLVERKAVQIVQARIAGAEIIDGQSDAEPADGLQLLKIGPPRFPSASIR